MKTAEDILNNKSPLPMVTIGPDATLSEAVERMNSFGIGTILIEKNGEIIGIWTERDLLRTANQPDFNPATAIICDHMQRQLHFASNDTPLEQLEEMFLGLYIHHILIKKQDRFIGLLSIGDVLRASLLEKVRRSPKFGQYAKFVLKN